MISKARQGIAKTIDVSEKTYRLIERQAWGFNEIEDKVSPEVFELFSNAFYAICADRKKCLSRSQVVAMAEYDTATLTEFINEFSASPKQAKKIYRKYFGVQNYSVKITFEVEGIVNEILAERAKEKGMSKTQYISGLMTLIALSDD